jgi:hypothetical protein
MKKALGILPKDTLHERGALPHGSGNDTVYRVNHGSILSCPVVKVKGFGGVTGDAKIIDLTLLHEKGISTADTRFLDQRFIHEITLSWGTDIHLI